MAVRRGCEVEIVQFVTAETTGGPAEIPDYHNDMDVTENNRPAPLGVVDDILMVPSRGWDGPRSVLLVGPEGCGKTTFLNQVASRGRSAGYDVIRPLLPVDVTGTTVGATEDLLLSMVSWALTGTNDQNRSLVLMDDIDVVIGEQTMTTDGGNTAKFHEPHLTARIRNLFLTLLDVIQGCNNHQRHNINDNRNMILLVCSAKSNIGKALGRFDRVLSLTVPGPEERRGMISSCLETFPGTAGDGQSTEAALSNLIDCTLGMSRSDLSQLCRQALLEGMSQQDGEEEGGTVPLLEIMHQKLQSTTPESLKSGANDDFVAMRVLTAHELLRRFPIRRPNDSAMDLPIVGGNARAAWDGLRRHIVLPICQGGTLDRLLHGDDPHPERSKVFAGGVLLAAPPGTGKSTLAGFCAAFAASINPSVKLIDVSCTSLIHKEVGSSERALHRLFRVARSVTPCIVVMDGIETIAAVRGNDNTTEGTMDRVLSTLLTELDGVDNERPVDVVGAQNVMTIIGITHNLEWIDPALRRPGRLEQTIWLTNPELDARRQIALKELDGASFKPDPDHPHLKTLRDVVELIAVETHGLSGAGVIAACNEAKLLASKAYFLDQKHDPCLTAEIVLHVMDAQCPGNISC
jgi:SpoVK/Ycf46/Vps4 family AAA+-type ATPase